MYQGDASYSTTACILAGRKRGRPSNASKQAAAALRALSTAKPSAEAATEAAESPSAAAAAMAMSPSDPTSPKFAALARLADITSSAGKGGQGQSQYAAGGKEPNETAQGQEPAQLARDGRSRSRSMDLPLSILLDGGPAKKRGRPYKSAANAEKAAQRDARRAATEAAEKVAYQAASEAAQVVIAAPPAKKRRGRPPKDPAKLAAALAAYHANTHARQAMLEAEERRAGASTLMDAAQDAEAQATAAGGDGATAVASTFLENVSPPSAPASDGAAVTAAATPQPVKKKRGRPPKSIVQAVGDNLHSPTDSHPPVDSPDDYMRQDDIRSNDDDHQALLDAAAVLTSDLPFPQQSRRQAVPSKRPRSRKARGRRRSGSHPDAVKAAAAKSAAAPDKQRRRGLEVVSSRAAALLESIGLESNAAAETQSPSPEPRASAADASAQHQAAPPVGSDLDIAAPPQSGYPSNRHPQRGLSSQQPATAASGSAGVKPQSTPELIPPLTSPELLQRLSESVHDATHAHTDGSSAGAVQTATASSPHLEASPGLTPPHAASGKQPG